MMTISAAKENRYRFILSSSSGANKFQNECWSQQHSKTFRRYHFNGVIFFRSIFLLFFQIAENQRRKNKKNVHRMGKCAPPPRDDYHQSFGND